MPARGIADVSDQRLALALEAARLGTWTWDMTAGTTTWDVRLEELHGLPSGGFGGTYDDWLAALHPDDRAECVARVEKALANPGSYTLLHRTVWQDETIHYVECRGTVLVDSDGQPIGTTGVALDVTAREHQNAATTQALAQEREVVQTLQQALLPAAIPQVPGVKVATRYIAAQRSPAIGGDWYAILPLRNGRVGLAIGDVAGHGLAAVADMAAARFGLRALALAEDDPERVLDQLNETVRVFASDTMITALYGILDPAALTWTYATAGHCPALLRCADGRTKWLDAAVDPPLGVARSFHRHTADLETGSTLILYTDGLIERRTEPITTGLDRLARAAADGPESPEDLCDHLSETLLRDTAVSDDVALVVVAIG